MRAAGFHLAQVCTFLVSSGCLGTGMKSMGALKGGRPHEHVPS
jgi:hypothetical protein